MDKEKVFYIVEASALSDVVIKVMEAKRLLESGNKKTVQAAATAVGISRSAFYKYRDLVFPFYENTRGKTVTFALNLENKPGLLSSILNCIANSSANVLTINQNIPINQIANVTFTIETGEKDIAQLVKALEKIEGILSLKIIARE